MTILPVDKENRPRVKDFLRAHWFSTDIVIRGRAVDASQAEGYLALEADEILGLLTYACAGDALEVLSLDSLRENEGIGSRLLALAEETASHRGCLRVRLITTNDNVRAIRFYQRRGYELTALYYGALEESRKLKPSIPQIGLDGIPLRSELEFRKEL